MAKASKKTARKAAKPTEKKKVAEVKASKEVMTEIKAVKSQSYQLPGFLTHKYTPVAAGAIALLVLVAYVLKGQVVVAWVNGKPITKMAYVAAMEQQVGPQTLENMVMDQLINQKAVQTGTTVSQDEIDAEMANIESRFSGSDVTLDDLLAQQGMTRQGLADQIRIQKLVEKMAPQNASSSAEEVNTFIEQNKDYLPEDATQAELEDIARQQLETQNSQDQMQAWVDSLKQEANITYWK